MYLNQTAPQPQKEEKKEREIDSLMLVHSLSYLQVELCKIDYSHGKRRKCFKETNSGVYPKGSNSWMHSICFKLL